MKKVQTPINGVVEPDFLKYLEDTFSRWNQLFTEGVSLGTREVAKFEAVMQGARLNAHAGFTPVAHRHFPDNADQEHFTVEIYQNTKAIAEETPLFVFDTPIHH